MNGAHVQPRGRTTQARHVPATAKNAIFLFMDGGPSHIDTFDPKPELDKHDGKKLTPENREFIASKMNSATWMIQAIEQRRQTMLKVMNFIVDRQRDFFEKGVEFLKPLTLREVAEVINMHESTVSRVTNEKFVQTPRGVLPLKFFLARPTRLES